ncbi:MAG TPA: hypothetical protein VFC07_05000, partial [Verrucomicrobiae bacterium]|nr:hypothetical protein [Verrucomicrobiae bacterium]
MNRTNLTRFIIVLAVLAWSFAEMYPPLGRDVGEVFQEKAVNLRKDAAFTNIVSRYNELQKQNPRGGYRNLVVAVGTNDVTHYFPQSQYHPPDDATDQSRWVLNELQKEAAGRIKLGLDLIGGSEFVIELQTNSTAGNTNMTEEASQQQALSQAIDVISRRINKFGVAEPVIQPESGNRILIQLPGLSDAERDEARRTISTVAYLEFKLVLSNSDESVLQNEFQPGYEFLKYPHKANDGRDVPGYLVSRAAVMTGDSIVAAFLERNSVGQANIGFKMNSSGADKFAEITRENVGRQLAIVLDGVLKSAPVIRGEIPGGSGVIEGNFTDEEAIKLANVLQ